jgi:addiction module HigA family antidote
MTKQAHAISKSRITTDLTIAGVSGNPKECHPMTHHRARQPIHPGEILAEDVLAELGMSATQLAKALGVPPNRISEIVRGRRDITADTALRLARWLGTTPEFWLDLQQAYDLEIAEQTIGDEVRRTVEPREPALSS